MQKQIQIIGNDIKELERTTTDLSSKASQCCKKIRQNCNYPGKVSVDNCTGNLSGTKRYISL